MARTVGAAVIASYCWDCDAPVRAGWGGWYRCGKCGYESLRAAEVDVRVLEAAAECPCPDCCGVDALRRPQAGAGLVSFSIKGEKQ